MTDLRFRVWRTGYTLTSDTRPPYVVSSCWVHGMLIQQNGTIGEDDYGVMSVTNPDAYALERSTGLRDQKGALIYENDILRGTLPVMGGPDIEWHGTVMWDEERARFVAVGKAGDMRALPLLGGCEVVGNVHETTT